MGLFWGLGVAVGLVWGCSRVVLERFWGYYGAMVGLSRGCPGGVQWRYSGADPGCCPSWLVHLDWKNPKK